MKRVLIMGLATLETSVLVAAIGGQRADLLVVDDVPIIEDELVSKIINEINEIKDMNPQHPRLYVPEPVQLKYHERFNTGRVPKLRTRK